MIQPKPFAAAPKDQLESGLEVRRTACGTAYLLLCARGRATWAFDVLRDPRQSSSLVKDKIIDALVSGFYTGRIPYAPGTWGTLIAVPLTWVLSTVTQATPVFYMVITVALILLAAFLSELHEQKTGDHDPKGITIDEIVGYMVAMTWLPATWQSYFGAFVLFRFFDILKPFPISYIDRKIEGGLGTVLDDVAAGLVTNVILQIVFAQTTWLGVRLQHGNL